MATIKGGILGIVDGSIAGVTYTPQRTAHGVMTIGARKRHPENPNTAAQQANRANFALRSQAVSLLPSAFFAPPLLYQNPELRYRQWAMNYLYKYLDLATPPAVIFPTLPQSPSNGPVWIPTCSFVSGGWYAPRVTWPTTCVGDHCAPTDKIQGYCLLKTCPTLQQSDQTVKLNAAQRSAGVFTFTVPSRYKWWAIYVYFSHVEPDGSITYSQSKTGTVYV